MLKSPYFLLKLFLFIFIFCCFVFHSVLRLWANFSFEKKKSVWSNLIKCLLLLQAYVWVVVIVANYHRAICDVDIESMRLRICYCGHAQRCACLNACISMPMSKCDLQDSGVEQASHPRLYNALRRSLSFLSFFSYLFQMSNKYDNVASYRERDASLKSNSRFHDRKKRKRY